MLKTVAAVLKSMFVRTSRGTAGGQPAPIESAQPTPPPFLIRDGTGTDLEWIVSLYEVGIAGGHFGHMPRPGIADMVAQVIAQRTMRRQGERRGKPFFEFVKAWVRIAEIDGRPAGFLINAAREPGSQEIEVYLMATNPEFMRRHVAQRLIEDTLLQYEGRRFYARCYPKSIHAFGLLRRNGFKHYNTQPRGTRELRLGGKPSGRLSRRAGEESRLL